MFPVVLFPAAYFDNSEVLSLIRFSSQSGKVTLFRARSPVFLPLCFSFEYLQIQNRFVVTLEVSLLPCGSPALYFQVLSTNFLFLGCTMTATALFLAPALYKTLYSASDHFLRLYFDLSPLQVLGVNFAFHVSKVYFPVLV